MYILVRTGPPSGVG